MRMSCDRDRNARAGANRWRWPLERLRPFEYGSVELFRKTGDFVDDVRLFEGEP